MRTKTSFDRNPRNVMRRSHLVIQKIFILLKDKVKESYILSVRALIDHCFNSDTKHIDGLVGVKQLFISSKTQTFCNIKVLK